jgi:hypothetical protein
VCLPHCISMILLQVESRQNSSQLQREWKTSVTLGEYNPGSNYANIGFNLSNLVTKLSWTCVTAMSITSPLVGLLQWVKQFYIYIYIYTYVYIYIYTYIYLSTYIYVYITLKLFCVVQRIIFVSCVIWKFCLHYVLRDFLCFNSMQLDRNTLPKKGLRYIFLSAKLLPFFCCYVNFVCCLFSSLFVCNVAPDVEHETTFNLDAFSDWKSWWMILRKRC